MRSNINFQLAVFATILIIGLNSLNYSDLAATGIACPDMHSCARRDSKEINCECDTKCVVYNDCCIDFRRGSTRRPIRSRFTCMPLDLDHPKGIYAISTCKRNWTGPNDVQNKCEVLSDLSDPLVATPVTNTRRSVTYRNRYCAECNRAVPDDLSSWEIYVFCDVPYYEQYDFTSDDWTYDADQNQWSIMKDGIYYACKISFNLPRYLQSNVRECIPNVIGTCPRTWRRKHVKRMCKGYTAIIHRGEDLYRNPHCAMCNDINLGEMNCGRGDTWLPGLPRPFAVLFDVNRSDGDIVGVTSPKLPSCPAKQTYDPFFKKCRQPVCALPGFKLVNGQCVRT